MEEVNIFWFRRDLRLYDNSGLSAATHSKNKVIPIFIFDTSITDKLPNNDRRINFIFDNLVKIDLELKKKFNSSINVFKGNPTEIFKELIRDYKINSVFTNNDYEPYALSRDKSIKNLLEKNQIQFKSFKDQVIFDNSSCHTLANPPKGICRELISSSRVKFNLRQRCICNKEVFNNFYNSPVSALKKLNEYGFIENDKKIEAFKLNSDIVTKYADTRNFPSINSTSKIGPYLRFGTVSVRKIVSGLLKFKDQTFLNELIWREFFMQILFHFPHTAKKSFKSKYDKIIWLNDPKSFEAWKNGETGFPLVDAGMKELNNTGFMHNRVRMITASFLCKHLLIDWRLGEKYFALKLNDYEMASNVGNWQWASGSGVDAAPYFRIFNPHTQITKFDKNREYINKWVDTNSKSYPNEIVDHKFARQRCLDTYKMYLD